MPGSGRPTEPYLRAYRIRRLEETLLELFARGELDGTVHTCLGQEFTGLAVAPHLDDRDVVVSNHRCHGHYLARFGDCRPLLAEILGRPSGLCRGFGGSQHLYRPGFFSSGIQAGMSPFAAGQALARQVDGQGGIVALFIGDGTLGEGLIYEVMNLASKHRLPLLLVLENNGVAQSTSQRQTLAGDIAARPAAFGIPVLEGSTEDVDALLEVGERAVRQTREAGGPVFLLLHTYRLGPHSKGDDPRPPEELAAARTRDPLHRFLAERGEEPPVAAALRAIDEELAEDVRGVLAEDNSITLPPEPRADGSSPTFAPDDSTRGPTQAKAIRQALHRAFRDDPNLFFLGEDIEDPYGGAFKISQGLSTAFPGRVRNMPISEGCIAGTALGLATAGRPCLAEVMFGDFLPLAFDQILNHAAKMHRMFGITLPVPLLIRTPMGGGRGYGATHSQSLEKFLLGIPDLDLFVLHPRADVERLYGSLLPRPRRCAVVIENKLLYGRSAAAPRPEAYTLLHSDDRFPLSWLRPPQAADVTVVAFGGAGLLAEEAATRLRHEEVYLDLFLPLDVGTFALTAVVESLRITGRLCLLEEGQPAAGLGGETLRRVMQHPKLDRPPLVRSVGAAERPIPSARYLEAQALPSAERLCHTLLELFDA